MRRPRNVWTRLGVLEERRAPFDRWRCDWNLDALSDAELEALMPLSAKQAEATAASHEPVWTPAELALLAELGTKAGVGR
jgi:hypothetical protein